jgi:hypothetical protein
MMHAQTQDSFRKACAVSRNIPLEVGFERPQKDTYCQTRV